MANDGDALREEIRSLIGDDGGATGEEERFDDNRINIYISSGLKRLKRILGISVTIDDGVLSPEPTDAEFDIIALQASCIISNRELYDASRKGVRVRQDENEVDTATGLGAFGDAVSSEVGVCGQLSAAIAQYIESGLATVDSAAAQYGENVWSGNSDVYSNSDHNGQAHERIYKPRSNNRNSTSDGIEGIDGNTYLGDSGRFTEG